MLRPNARLTVAFWAGVALIALGRVPADAGSTDVGRFSILRAFEQEMRAIVDAVAPSVVTVRATQRTMPGGGNSAERPMSVGSGVFLDSTGLIMTTSRVAEGADDFWIETFDGRMYQGVLLGINEDIALLQIKGCRIVPAQFGDAGEVGVGSLVAAVGNSYGYACGVSWGEINGFRPDGTIQMSLGISAGNSGGALVSTSGRIIGLVKAKISDPYYLDPVLCQSIGDKTAVSVPGRRLELPTSPVSLAIPIQTALNSAHRILESGSGPRAYLGVYVEDLTGWWVAHFKTSEGVLVIGVVDETPADLAGVRVGDLITAVDNNPVASVVRFRQTIARANPGQRMKFDLVRGGQSLKLVVEAGRADASHLAATERKARPFPDALRRRDNETQTAIPASQNVALRQVGTGEMLGNPARDREAEATEWLDRLNALECVIDSLQRELHLLRSKSPR